MNIRKISQKDLSQAQSVYLRSRRATFNWVDPKELKLSDFSKDTSDEEILVATEANQVVGFISIYQPDNFIHLLFVDPDQVNSGIGSLLLREALNRIGRPARLKCVSENEVALKFYKRNGWLLVDEIDAEPPYWNLVYLDD